MRVREYREDAGYSIRELAEMAGVSEVTLVHLEHGKTTPHPKTLRKIAGVLGVSVRELRGQPETPRYLMAGQRVPEGMMAMLMAER